MPKAALYEKKDDNNDAKVMVEFGEGLERSQEMYHGWMYKHEERRTSTSAEGRTMGADGKREETYRPI